MPITTMRPPVEPTVEFGEALDAFIDSWRNQPRVDPIVMSGVLSELALTIRRNGGLAVGSSTANATRQLRRPDSYDFRAAALDFLADWLSRVNHVTVAANLEIWATRLG
jgi:hypothetical protein